MVLNSIAFTQYSIMFKYVYYLYKLWSHLHLGTIRYKAVHVRWCDKTGVIPKFKLIQNRWSE